MKQNKGTKRLGRIYNYRKSISYYLNQCQERRNNLKMSVNFNSQILGTELPHKIIPKLLSLKKDNFPKYNAEQTDNVTKSQSQYLNNPKRKNAIIKLFASEMPRLQTKDNASLRASIDSSPESKPKSQTAPHLVIILSNKLTSQKFRKYKSRQSSPVTLDHDRQLVHRYDLLKLSTNSRKLNQYQSSILKLQPWQTKRDVLNETTQFLSKSKN